MQLLRTTSRYCTHTYTPVDYKRQKILSKLNGFADSFPFLPSFGSEYKLTNANLISNDATDIPKRLARIFGLDIFATFSGIHNVSTDLAYFVVCFL
jgi:hypothetical protein